MPKLGSGVKVLPSIPCLLYTSGALADEGAKSPDNDMVVALQADATHLDPHVSSNGYSNTITNAMYETLLTFNEKSEVVPLLAKEWSCLLYTSPAQAIHNGIERNQGTVYRNHHSRKKKTYQKISPFKRETSYHKRKRTTYQDYNNNR